MTVKEVIEELQAMPQDAVIAWHYWDTTDVRDFAGLVAYHRKEDAFTEAVEALTQEDLDIILSNVMKDDHEGYGCANNDAIDNAIEEYIDKQREAA